MGKAGREANISLQSLKCGELTLFPGVAWLVKNEGDLGSIPGLGRSLGEGKGYPLQYSGLENYTGSQRVRHN